jgi:hypothetical protein
VPRFRWLQHLAREGFVDIPCNGLGLVEHEISIHKRRNTFERMQIEIFDRHIRCEWVEFDMLIRQTLFGECDASYPDIDAVAKAVKDECHANAPAALASIQCST